MFTFKSLCFVKCLGFLVFHTDPSECQLCTGLEKCCFGYMWDGNLHKCFKCGLGYYGKNCSSKCIYPNFGEDCQNDCNCSKDACSFAFGCQNVTGSTQLGQESYTIEMTSKTKNTASETINREFDFKYLFLASIIALSCFVLLSVLCVIAFKKRYVKKTKIDKNYEDLGDMAVNMYSSLHTDETTPRLEVTSIGQIKLLSKGGDNEYTLELKTKPFKLNLSNCTCTVNIPDSTNDTNASDSLTEDRRGALSPGNIYMQVSSSENENMSAYSSLQPVS